MELDQVVIISVLRQYIIIMEIENTFQFYLYTLFY